MARPAGMSRECFGFLTDRAQCHKRGMARKAVVAASPRVGDQICIHKRRHARACPGHPRSWRYGGKDVDGRDKPGHDDVEAAISDLVILSRDPEPPDELRP